ncbi:MAG TPA: hypothetical protein VHN99_11470 [Deinococcales bacterium]|nr:hypothetical protein [Deinococcales bacterium]
MTQPIRVMSSARSCSSCQGSGRCPHCHGSGKQNYPGFGPAGKDPCSWCYGTGVCQTCRGAGHQ